MEKYKYTGFPIGKTTTVHTKGVWAWALEHPSSPGVYIVLLDTEGLGDPEKVSLCVELMVSIPPPILLTLALTNLL